MCYVRNKRWPIGVTGETFAVCVCVMWPYAYKGSDEEKKQEGWQSLQAFNMNWMCQKAFVEELFVIGYAMRAAVPRGRTDNGRGKNPVFT